MQVEAIAGGVRPSRREAMALLGAAAAAAGTWWPGTAHAAVPRIQAGFTNLSSDSDRIISYRHQEHLWQTADGAFHLVMNRGTLTPGPGLCLYSSHDGGTSWSHQWTFLGTDTDSVSDGQLAGDLLSVLYQTVTGHLVHQQLRYDAAGRGWTVERDEMALVSDATAGINPGMAADALGNLWCCFVARDRITNDVQLRLLVRPAGATGWSDTGVVFGPTDRRSIERSGRPVPIAGGMGIVFTVREMTYWAQRSDTQALDAPWDVTTVFAGTPAFRTTDPYASHFSVVADDAGSVHLATIEENRMLHFTRDAATGRWSTSGILLSGTKKLAYGQNCIANGRLMVAWSVQRGFGNLVESTDGGRSFSETAVLVLPANADGVSYGQARVELPTRCSGPLLALQQYSDNGVVRLMRFLVPQR
ncbi:hypothetical protein ACPOLB_01905 [Rubrivivax sp. RP6-9]|uniref:hypothetical protein n=1 Tax=Rubrivivax sp. RP6-9 TaxID=3415750 RepID=UPI003CC62F3C